jgi:hypothetical protein
MPGSEFPRRYGEPAQRPRNDQSDAITERERESHGHDNKQGQFCRREEKREE